MCGIFGYTSKNPKNLSIAMTGLKRLEYRGYDSAGLSMLDKKGSVWTLKAKGKLKALQALLAESKESSTCIAHTRWATHGEPNEKNAHPHLSQDNRIALVHNGIVENYLAIKKRLEKEDYVFRSETDTEVIVHLIDYVWKETGKDLESAVCIALREIVGAFSICVIASKCPGKMIVARRGSPMLIGVSSHGHFAASDKIALVGMAEKVIHLSDDEVGVLTADRVEIKTLDHVKVPSYIEELKLDVSQIEKGGYPHYMLKEIFEQPATLYNSIRGRVRWEDGRVHLGGLIDVLPKLLEVKRIIITGCGSSWHAALVGQYLIEKIARMPVRVEYASEFRYRDPVLSASDAVILVSQSGETADTLAAIKEVRDKGAMVLGVCNVPGSSLSRETDHGIHLRAGYEIGVASTKAFLSQVSTLTCLAYMLASEKKLLSKSMMQKRLHQFREIPKKIEKVLLQDSFIKEIAKTFSSASNFLYLGRGIHFPVALEGALKLKEVSYIHAEGYPAAEIKHGPIALIDKHMPVVFIIAKDSLYQKCLSNIQEIRARKGVVIAIATEGDTEIENHADHVIFIPPTPDLFSPLLSVVPLQLLAYHIAVIRGCDVDQPRNLAKSVTVE